MKKYTAIFSLILVLCLLTGCAGSPVVYYSDCTCPVGSHVQETPATEAPNTEAPVVTEGAVKTGLAIVTSAKKLEGSARESGIEYDVTIAAVLVDANGVIVDCYIDSISTQIVVGVESPDDISSGIYVLKNDITLPVLTKNELGDEYGMKADAGSKYEWYEQAEALAQYAIGKTVEQLRNGAVNESGKAADADLASTATIYLGGYVDAIEKAVANAQHLGAQSGDALKIAVLASRADSHDSDAENPGNAQLNVDVTAITMNGDVITSCVIDAVQTKVPFGPGAGDVPSTFSTKNELGEAYGMKAWGGAKYEWNEQAANFAAYVTGKTLAEIQGIAVDEATKPADADLSTSVTIAIGGFQALIEKAIRPADELKSGLAIHTITWPSAGMGHYYTECESVVAAVLVDKNGVIQSCVIRQFTGALRNSTQMGTSYIEVDPIFEETEELRALADYAVGKTAGEIMAGVEPDAFMMFDQEYVYHQLLAKAASHAEFLGAKKGDELKLAVTGTFDGSDFENDKIQLDVDMAAITMDADVITSCVLDSMQAVIVYTEDAYSEYPTKNELGEAYGMKAWGGARYEWNEQAANFAAYVTGKTLAEIQGIAVDEATKPADADLSTSVTIAIGGFQALIEKAARE